MNIKEHQSIKDNFRGSTISINGTIGKAEAETGCVNSMDSELKQELQGKYKNIDGNDRKVDENIDR